MGEEDEPRASTSASTAAVVPAYADFVCGGSAALCECLLVYPIHKTAFRQQLHGISIRESLRQLSCEGLARLYRGVLPPLLQKTASRALMFGVYDELQRSLSGSGPGFSPAKAAAAFAAGATEAVLTPFERVQVLLQSNRYHENFANTRHAFVEVRRGWGLAEFYRGLGPILLRNGSTSVAFFGLREPIKAAILGVGGEAGEWRVFWAEFGSGAILGACLSTAVFPINVIRVAKQSRLGGAWEASLHVLRRLFSERGGWAQLYRGSPLNYTRSLLSWGITNAAFGSFQRHLGWQRH